MIYTSRHHKHLQHCILFYSTLLYSTTVYCTVLYSTLLYSTLLSSTVLYSALSNSPPHSALHQHLSWSTICCLATFCPNYSWAKHVYNKCLWDVSLQTHLVLHGPIWSFWFYMVPFGLFGSTWSHLVLFALYGSISRRERWPLSGAP